MESHTLILFKDKVDIPDLTSKDVRKCTNIFKDLKMINSLSIKIRDIYILE